MSRLTLCVLTAAVLAAISVGIMTLRQQVLGDELHAPAGPNTYHVTVLVRGKSSGDARLTTLCPLDFNRQHVFCEDYQSAELAHRPGETQRPERRQVQWSQKVVAANTMFQARYEFHCKVNVHHPTAWMTQQATTLYGSPAAGEHIKAEPRIESGAPAISELALDLSVGLDSPADHARALFQFVDRQVLNDPGMPAPGMSALECLKTGRSGAAGQSRLLVALCRNRGIPARLVTGLVLSKRSEQQAHTWAEVWVGDHWMSFCPFSHHCGRVPATYLVFGYGDQTLVRGHNVRGLTYSCLAEQKPTEPETAAKPSLLRRIFERTSLFTLPPGETGLVEFLLLLPVAALIICIFRNLIGLQSFGTFAPALIGLAFRRSESMAGILVFVSIILVGWGLRRALDRYHLLQVPRTAFLLSMVVVVLLSAILAANFYELAPTRYIALFPMVILAGMIERFWTLETEDGTTSSFKTLLSTMFIAATISLVLSRPEVVGQMFRYPETLGLLMAVQLLIGRYTGYRLSELFRFRDLVRQPPRRPEDTAVQRERLAITLLEHSRGGVEWPAR